MLDVTLKITLTLKAPFITKSSDAGAFGIDAPLARTHNGKFYFPRKLIKGCLRQAWRDLEDVVGEPSESERKKWLGDKSNFEAGRITLISPRSSVEPMRGTLLFANFVTEQAGKEKTISRIRIDGRRGAVEENHLLFIEAPFETGEEVAFAGEIRFFAKDEPEAARVENWVIKGLSWITNLGAFENVNFGQLVKVKLTNEPCKPLTFADAKATGAEVLSLRIRPREAFCIAKKNPAANLFGSEEFIPGAVVKGALAEILFNSLGEEKEFEPLRNSFSAIRFTHAFPSPAGEMKRAVVPPLSLVKINAPKFYDAANFDKPFLIGATPQAPAFAVDWKNREDVDAAFGWARPKKNLRVQTAIENNRAKEQDLYAYEEIIPDGVDWLGRIDLSRLTAEAERREIEELLRKILAFGLVGIGKTKASARTEIFNNGELTDQQISNAEAVGRQWIITLQTPALLCDSKDLDETSGASQLRTAYENVWETLSDGLLNLVRYFASQSLAGGEYLYKRFQFGNPYNPYLLTDPGSVFVLKATDETEARKKIESWLKQGLSLPDWAQARYSRNGTKDGGDWQNCPFIPENGYGEIAVNLEVHQKNAPQKGEYYEIY